MSPLLLLASAAMPYSWKPHPVIPANHVAEGTREVELDHSRIKYILHTSVFRVCLLFLDFGIQAPHRKNKKQQRSYQLKKWTHSHHPEESILAAMLPFLFLSYINMSYAYSMETRFLSFNTDICMCQRMYVLRHIQRMPRVPRHRWERPYWEYTRDREGICYCYKIPNHLVLDNLGTHFRIW